MLEVGKGGVTKIVRGVDIGLLDLFCVVDTDKGGGRLVPLGGVFYETYAEALHAYDRALKEIYNNKDTYGALLVCELIYAEPPV